MPVVIVNSGQQIPPKRLAGLGTEPNFIGWGTGAGTTGVGDTDLFSEAASDLVSTSGTRVYGASSAVTTLLTKDTYQVTGTCLAYGPGTVTNAGLWDDMNIGSGNLYLKGDFPGVSLAAGDAIAFTFKVQFA